MTKKCGNCNKKYTAKHIILNAYAKNEIGHWYNCRCGSTLLLRMFVLDYSEIQSKIPMNENNI